MTKTRKALILLIIACVAVAILASLTIPREAPSRLEAESKTLQGLKATLKLNKATFRVGEPIRAECSLINLGSQPITLYHGHPLLHVEIYDTSGNLVYTYPEVSITILVTTTLQPGEYHLVKYVFPLKEEGRYLVAARAAFYLQDPAKTRGEGVVKLYTDRLPVEITPA